jgi:cytosine/adenosine deaminase-related metal-dependent hydrolase
LQIFSTSWVVPVSRPPIPRGRVAVDGGRVTWVGAPGDAGEPRGSVQDLGPGVLMPGLVNAHCHLELSHLAGLSDQGTKGFVPWVESLMARRGETDANGVRAATRRAIRQLESTGTVAVGDVSNAMAHLDLLEASHLQAVVFYELLGWDPARAETILQAASDILELSKGTRTMKTRVRLAAHAPYSVSPALLAGIVARGGPGSMHIAESPAETRFLATGEGDWRGFLQRKQLGHVAFQPAGRSPVAYVNALGGLREGMVAAHCVQVDDADCGTLARQGVNVAVCPRSNRNLRVGVAPIRRLLEAGVRLCLGTDSLASASTLDLMADMALLQSQFPDLAPEVIVRLATLGGAEALGLADLGTIEAGKRGDLAFVPATDAPAEPLRFLMSGAAQAGPLPA